MDDDRRMLRLTSDHFLVRCGQCTVGIRDGGHGLLLLRFVHIGSKYGGCVHGLVLSLSRYHCFLCSLGLEVLRCRLLSSSSVLSMAVKQ